MFVTAGLVVGESHLIEHSIEPAQKVCSRATAKYFATINNHSSKAKTIIETTETSPDPVTNDKNDGAVMKIVI